ncbi:MAG: ankyrin repeat domain-containing protein [Leptospirales bacterium]|nr:ankyrin repeat domain-containing protein [Leptospirales bacterium]
MAKNQFYEPLRGAAMMGNTQEIRKLVASGADPNLTGGYGTILAAATWYNNLEAVQTLLDLGAKPNLNNGEALCNAVTSPNQNEQSPDVVRVLAQKGADVNRIYKVQSELPEATALMAAIFFGYVKTAEALIELGADLAYRNKKDQSAFNLASDNNLLKLCQMMLDHGYKPNPRSKAYAAFLKKVAATPDRTNNYLEQRYFLMPEKMRTNHISGEKDLRQILDAELLPLCPNPAVNLLSLDLREFNDLPAKIRRIGILHVPFYCCSDCNGEPDELEFKISQTGKLKLLSNIEGDVSHCDSEAACGPHEPAYLKIETEEPERRCGILIGGSPDWCQSPAWAQCSECGENGFFIGSISQALVPPGHGGPDNVLYIFVCGDCRTETIVRQMT